MLRISLLLISVCLLTGCAESFNGEWLEDSSADPNGALTQTTGGRRAALQFDGISTVRTGAYSERAGVVDAQTVSQDPYFVFDGGQSAQFGSILARLHGQHMITSSAAGVGERHYTRIHGRSIFPPLVTLPELTRVRWTLEPLASAE